MNQINETIERVLYFEIYWNNNFKCWCCKASLDFEDKFFDNICEYCGSTQGYDKEKYERW